MAYGDFKDLPIRTGSGEVLARKHLISLKIQNMIDFNLDLLQLFIHF